MIVKLRDWKPNVRTKAIVDELLELIPKYNIDLTVRQCHYKIVESKLELPNILATYRKISRLLTNMRYAGMLSWDKIIDETRGIYKTQDYQDIDTAMKHTLDNYRRNRWKDNGNYVEVWTEKRTLVNQFYPITNKYDVYLASGGGFSSATYIKDAVKRLYPKMKQGKDITILYFGDMDPSGDFMDEDIEERFKEWGVKLHFIRLALTEDQLDTYKLKRKFDVKKKYGKKVKNKLEQDPRAKKFKEKYGELFQVELEALDPQVLNDLLENAILDYADLQQQEEVKQVERKEVEEIKEKLDYE